MNDLQRNNFIESIFCVRQEGTTSFDQSKYKNFKLDTSTFMLSSKLPEQYDLHMLF